MILKVTIAQIVKTSVTVNNSSAIIQDYVHLDDHTQPTYENNKFIVTVPFLFLFGDSCVAFSDFVLSA